MSQSIRKSTEEEQKKEIESVKNWFIQYRNHLNIAAFSREIGVDVSNFHKYLDGKQAISFERQKKIVEVLKKFSESIKIAINTCN